MKFKEYLQEQLHESSLSRIWQYTQNYNMGIATAFRGALPLEENKQRNRQLEKDIRAAGFGFVKVTGFYIENPGTPEETKVKEESYVVVTKKTDDNKLKDFLKKEGQKFDQDSVLYKGADDKAVLIGTAEGRWPGLDKEEVVGDWKPNVVGQFYTKLRGHGTFVFESFDEPSNINTLSYRNRKKKL